MKYIVIGVCLILANSVKAQAPFLQKKVAQARYNFSNTNWQGLDSNLYNYDINGNELINTSLNTTTGNWDWNIKSVNVYNSNEKLIQTIRQKYQSGAWVNLRKLNYVLNGVDSVVESHDSIWNTNINAWAFNGKISNQYNTDNQITETLLQTKDINGNPINALKTINVYDAIKKYLNETTNYSWDATNLIWVNKDKNIYAYNANDSVAQIDYYELPITGGTALDTISRTNYYYNINNNKISLMISQLYHVDSHFYFLYLKQPYTYNVNNLLQKKEYAIYDTANALWVYYQTDNWYYNANNLLEQFNSTSTNTSVTSNYSYQLLYNADNNIIDSSYSTGTTGNWVEKYKTTYNYDTYKNKIYKLIRENLGSGNYANIRQEFYYYNQEPLRVKNYTVQKTIQCFPNPATNEIHISLQNIMPNSKVAICVYDANGKKRIVVQEIAQQSIYTLPISSLESGTYFIQLSNGSNLFTSKFVK